jgi:hypothetical protein
MTPTDILNFFSWRRPAGNQHGLVNIVAAGAEGVLLLLWLPLLLLVVGADEQKPWP